MAISWNDISSFSSKEIYAKEGDIYKLIFTLKDEMNHHKKQIKIELRRIDKEFTEVRDVITHYLKKYDIMDSGHKKVWF